MLSTGIRTPIGIKVFGKDLVEMEKLARQIETVVKAVPGTTQRVCRAHHRRLLPQHRTRSRAAGALWPGGRRPARCGRHRAGRRDGHHHGGGPRALWRDGALPARVAQRPAADRARGADSHHGRRHDPAGAVGQGRRRQGSARHPHRERAAVGLHLCRHPRPRHRRLCGGCEEGGGRAGQVPARLLRDLERPVRVHGARHRENEDRDPGHAADRSSCCCTSTSGASPRR